MKERLENPAFLLLVMIHTQLTDIVLQLLEHVDPVRDLPIVSLLVLLQLIQLNMR